MCTNIYLYIKIIVVLIITIKTIVLSELQSSVDQLLGEKIQLCEQVEVLKKEKEELKVQVHKMLREGVWCAASYVVDIMLLFWEKRIVNTMQHFLTSLLPAGNGGSRERGHFEEIH